MTLPHPDGYVPNLPNCGIVAIAVVTGQHYRTIWDWFKKRNNHPAQWKGRTYFRDYSPVLHAFGVKFKMSEWVGDGITVEGFVDWHTKPNTTYMVRVAGHIFLLRNGIITDNTNKHGKSYKGFARRRVKHVWEILK